MPARRDAIACTVCRRYYYATFSLLFQLLIVCWHYISIVKCYAMLRRFRDTPPVPPLFRRRHYLPLLLFR